MFLETNRGGGAPCVESEDEEDEVPAVSHTQAAGTANFLDIMARRCSTSQRRKVNLMCSTTRILKPTDIEEWDQVYKPYPPSPPNALYNSSYSCADH
jgi:hypothetical protein